MKHRAMTPLRWLRRLPGRIYRNQGARFFIGGIIAYQIAFQIAWRLAGKPDQTVMTAFAWVCILSAYLALTVVTFVLRRQGKKYWHEGHENYDYALTALTMVNHGRYKAKPADDGHHDLSCACGVYLGTIPADSPEQAFEIIEQHADTKIREIQDEVEKKADAAKV